MGKKINEKAIKNFGLSVREMRRGLGLTQEQLSEQCDMHPVFLSEIERGIRNPSLNTILQLSTGLKIEAGELVNISLAGKIINQEIKVKISAILSRQNADNLNRIYKIIKAYLDSTPGYTSRNGEK